MSSDLLNEFGIPANTSNGSAKERAVRDAAVEEDDFGDFETPETSGENTIEHANSCQSLNMLAAVPDIHKHTNTEWITGKDRVQSLTSLGSDVNPNDDARGELTDDSVFFDTDQAIAEGNSHLARMQISSNHLEHRKTATVSLLPVNRQRTVIPSRSPVQDPPSVMYDFNQSDDDWEPSNLAQDVKSPAKGSAVIAFTTTTESGDKPNIEAMPAVSGPTPSNIPPPSVLLAIVARQFQLVFNNVKDALCSKDLSLDSDSYNQARIRAIQKVLATVRAGARILAGRKLRWKRDNLLSQSMKIGPASGKASGMKLTGIDKTENRREDQEAVEVLSAWRKQVGPLRSTISAIKSKRPEGGLMLPHISENMPVRSVKSSEGAVTAPKACFLCGIKRDERIEKVDIDVEDSFGEWWCEHWGHVDCVAFWEKHKSSLPQR